MVFNLMEGFTMHHCNYIPNNFKSKNETKAKNDSDNAKILNDHLSPSRSHSTRQTSPT